MEVDRTTRAVRRQLQALACERYEIGVRDAAGRTLRRTWTEAEVLTSVNWLKRENAKGSAILIQPAETARSGLVLLDGLGEHALAALTAEGCEPVAVVETQPQHYQAWLRVSTTPLDAEVAELVGREIAKRFEVEVATGERGYGRLAGFSNRDAVHADGQGRRPWVLCHRAQASEPTAASTALVAWAQQRLAERERDTRLGSAEARLEGVPELKPVHVYQGQLKDFIARYGDDLDLERADYAICCRLATWGYPAERLEAMLREGSPAVPMRELAGDRAYSTRTVRSAVQAVLEPASRGEVREHERQRQRELSRSRGPDFER